MPASSARSRALTRRQRLARAPAYAYLRSPTPPDQTYPQQQQNTQDPLRTRRGSTQFFTQPIRVSTGRRARTYLRGYRSTVGCCNINRLAREFCNFTHKLTHTTPDRVREPSVAVGRRRIESPTFTAQFMNTAHLMQISRARPTLRAAGGLTSSTSLYAFRFRDRRGSKNLARQDTRSFIGGSVAPKSKDILHNPGPTPTLTNALRRCSPERRGC